MRLELTLAGLQIKLANHYTKSHSLYVYIYIFYEVINSCFF